MIKKTLPLAFTFMVLFLAMPIKFSFSESLKEKAAKDSIIVYTYEIKDMIAAPVWRLTQKAFDEAIKIKADLIIIHMNTYGGTLDHADSIRSKILNSKIPVWVFIDNNAEIGRASCRERV